MQDTKILQSVLDKVTAVDDKIEVGFKEVNERLDSIGKRIKTNLINSIT